MRNSAIFFIALFFVLIFNQPVYSGVDDDYFVPIWFGENPYQPMNIIVTSAKIDALNLSVNDEVGVFDIDSLGNEICVGSGIVSSTITPQNPLIIVTSADDPLTNNIDGFTSNNTILFRFWDDSNSNIITDIIANFDSNFDLVFTPLGTALVELSYLSNEPPLPIGHWALDETNGTIVNDASGNNLHGSLVNGALWDPNGKINGAVSCDGINDYIEIPDNDLLDPGASDFTVSFWVYKRAASSSWDNIWGVNKWNTGAAPGTNEWSIGLGASGNSNRPTFGIQSGTTSYGIASDDNISLNEWHLITGVRESEEIKLYVNGVLKGTKTVGTVSVNNVGRNVRIANSHVNNLYTDAIYDDVRIYDRALTQAEILALTQSINGPPVVYAGADRNIILPVNTVTLSGSATDDGLPVGSSLTTVWSKLSGPDNVVFTDSSLLNTSVSFILEGSYQLELTVSDGLLSSSDIMQVTVQPESSGGSPPIGHWALDETNGTIVNDASGNNLHGSLVNGALWDPNGKINGAVSCDGINDYIEIPDNDLLDPGASDFTVSFWVYKRAASSSWDNIWGVNKWNTGAAPGTNEWSIGLGASGNSNRPTFGIQSGTTSYGIASDDNISLNEWHLITGVRESEEIKLYVNGVLKGTKTVGTVSVNNVGRNVRIANSHVNNLYTDAIYDDVRIYDRALTQAEILALTQSINGPPVVYAGADRNIILPVNTVTLSGSATDDGLPVGSSLTTVWSKLSGPDNVVFTDSSLLNTSVSFILEGSYQLELTVSDGLLSSSDIMQVTVQPESSGGSPPIGHWALDETNGTIVNDASGNNLHGSLVNGALWDPNGKINGAVSCDGINDYIEIPDNDLLDPGASDFTVSFWVYKRAASSSWDNIWGVNKWNTGAAPGTNEWSIGLGASGNSNRPTFGIQSGTTSYGIASDDNISLNEWHLITGVRESEEIKLYVNGVLKGTKTVGTVSVNNVGRNVRIANSHVNNLYTDAIYDDVRIYDRALTQAEILELLIPASTSILGSFVHTYMDITICQGDSIFLNGIWQKSEATISESFKIEKGYDSISTINLKIEELPKVNLGDYFELKTGGEISLEAYYSGAQYIWQDGSTGHDYLVTQEGNYYVIVTNSCGSVADSVKIKYSKSEISIELLSLSVYPNPFTNSLHLTFLLSNQEKVLIAVYSIKGDMIKTLVNSILERGSHELIWDGTDENDQPLPSGAYFINLVTNNDKTQKVIIKVN